MFVNVNINLSYLVLEIIPVSLKDSYFYSTIGLSRIMSVGRFDK